MMAQTVDDIAETLDAMRVESQDINEYFVKVLSSINSKLEDISNDSEAEDLLKVYITELKNIVELNQNNTIREFNNVQNVLENILASKSELVNNSEFDKFRSVILENFSVHAFSLSE